ncbi:unnamed protein product [Hymenolepis diminuta]|uniref:Uncharacterized protein n=1 Tax=Hymenolepis diminuta TaxID=6216 RepID=A0A564YNA8_HYMDI|nr:unnamed protein product [Hymenolepis diminuta]
MFARALRAETRSRARDDSRRVHRTSEKVQKWEKKWISVKDTSMLVFKWVPVIEDEHIQPKKSGFARAQSNVLVPTGGSIITMSSHPPELRTEEKPLSESTTNATADNQPKSEPSSNENIRLGNDAEVKEESNETLSNDAPVDLTAA